MQNRILENLNLPDDVRKLTLKELCLLCEELREKIINVVSKNGGHLASNLGVVELTVALYKVFDFTKDDVVWDVGHQSYSHKILSGRLNEIDTIRKALGISGFPKINESPFDSFGTGHSSTSISAALGISEAKSLLNKDDSSSTIAVIGDGALTGGLAYEGLNNAGSLKRNFIVILNDNKMSISKNVGAMARYLSTIRVKDGYLKAKGALSFFLEHLPLFGKKLKQILLSSKSALKNFLYGTIFENMGFFYYPVRDGHNFEELIKTFSVVKNIKKPVLVHVRTVKGKGYSFAEKKPQQFHGISKFDITTGINSKKLSTETFSSVFGKALCSLAKENKKICAITAAMEYGTGLTEFSKIFKNRFFDVGIAEEHAVTFAAGLSSKGMVPVFAVYSSFLQRSYDQIIHDLALQNLKAIIAVDRAGIVGEDGETHQGIFDVPFLSSIPNVEIYSPSYFFELESILKDATKSGKLVTVIRYPKGTQGYKPSDFKEEISLGKDYCLFGFNGVAESLIVTYGRLFSSALLAREYLLKLGVNICILKLNKIKPVNLSVFKIVSNFKNIFFFEEGIRTGGVGESFFYNFSKYNKFGSKFLLSAIEDEFVKQDTVDSALKKLGLDFKGIKNTIVNNLKISDI